MSQMPEHEANANLNPPAVASFTGIPQGRPAYGTGIVYIHRERDGWDAHWSDDEGRLLVGPSPMTFPEALEWARSKPAPEIRIMTGVGPKG